MNTEYRYSPATQPRGAHGQYVAVTFTRREIEERFWQHVDRSESADACWLWTGLFTPLPYSYGYLKVGRHMFYKVHRLSYEICNGMIPEGLFVLHTCDNGLCVNPGHLWLGTHIDNMTDRNQKGRQAHGVQIPRTKLTREIADEIRRLHSDGWTYRKLAHYFKVRSGTIWALLTNKTWHHPQ